MSMISIISSPMFDGKCYSGGVYEIRFDMSMCEYIYRNLKLPIFSVDSIFYPIGSPAVQTNIIPVNYKWRVDSFRNQIDPKLDEKIIESVTCMLKVLFGKNNGCLLYEPLYLKSVFLTGPLFDEEGCYFNADLIGKI